MCFIRSRHSPLAAIGDDVTTTTLRPMATPIPYRRRQYRMEIACTQMLLYFSFRSFGKHCRGRERARERERRTRGRKILIFSSSPAPTPLLIFYHARVTDFEEKIQALRTGWFGNGLVRVGTKGLFCPCLKTFVAYSLHNRLTTPGSSRIMKVLM